MYKSSSYYAENICNLDIPQKSKQVYKIYKCRNNLEPQLGQILKSQNFTI